MDAPVENTWTARQYKKLEYSSLTIIRSRSTYRVRGFHKANITLKFSKVPLGSQCEPYWITLSLEMIPGDRLGLV